MESPTIETNGGNAEVARDEPNLENVETPTTEFTNDIIPDGNAMLVSIKMEEQQPTTEVNGDVKTTKKKLTPGAKRKLRKFKANSTGSPDIDAKSHTRGQKRKISEPDDLSSEDSTEFNGFDTKVIDNAEPGSHVLQKLIAEAESTEAPQTKRLRRSAAKGISAAKNMEERDDDMELDESKEEIANRIKREKESDTDSIGVSNSLDSETDPLKTEESSVKSGNSSANSSPSGVGPKLKVVKVVRNMSPAGGLKPTKVVDMSNPVYREPFKYGWKRELVFRAGSDQHTIRRMADIYYYTPKGKKVRSFREVAEFLNTKELTIDNFTFFKEPLGVNNPEYEIIRDARVRDSTGPAPTPPRKSLPGKKTPAKRIVEKPLTPPLPARTAAKSPKATPASLKIKLPGKKGQQKKEAKSPPKPPVVEPPMLPPQWSSPATTRRSQPIVEKTPPAKTKRVPKKKLAPPENDQRHFMVSVCAGYNALSRIFQYLKVQELLRAARVCRMWRDLAAHPNLWKTVRMKNSQVTDWDGLADSLKRHGTQHLDLRKMLVAGESDGIWRKFVTVIPRVTSLVKLELCRCPVMVVEEVIKRCPQLEVLSAMSIKCDSLNLESVGNLKSCQELRLKAISGMSLQGDLTPLQELTQLTHLSLTSVKELGKKSIEILGSLINLETLELGECSDFPDKFGTSVLLKLEKLERLRLEKGQGTCCTFDILEGVSKLATLNQLELVNFDVKNGFDKCLSNCKNIKRLLIIPTYISQSATSNNMVLGGVTELSNNLTHFVWGVTLELLRVTELFVDQCNQMSKQVTGDSIPVLKPVPCLKLIEDVEEDADASKGEEKPQPSLTNPQVDILPLPQLQKLLLTALPKTRVKILKIPFHATWRQSISDTTTQ